MRRDSKPVSDLLCSHLAFSRDKVVLRLARTDMPPRTAAKTLKEVES